MSSLSLLFGILKVSIDSKESILINQFKQINLMTKPYFICGIFFLLNTSFANAQTFTCGDTLIDIDGNAYPTVLIAGKCWMQENLRTTHCSNNTPIPLTTDTITWDSLTSPGYTSYGGDSNNINTYGILYNGYAAMDPCGICPQGWSIPSDADWTEMVDSLGGEIIGGGPLKETTGWTGSNTGATNSSGFTAKPGGFRVANGSYDYLGNQARFWTSTMATSQNGWTRVLYFNNATVGRLNYHRKNGLSIRCIQNMMTGMGEIESTPSFQIFPNPASHYLTINVISRGEIDVTIFNSLGKRVYAMKSWNDSSINVNLSDFNNGVYIVQVEESGQSRTKKLIVAK